MSVSWVAGFLLVAGALSLASAFAIVGSRRSLMGTAGGNRMAARLAAVDTAPGAWRALLGFFIGALALTACGDAVLAVALFDAGERVWSAVGTAVYLVAAPIGIAALALQFAFSLWQEGGVDRGERGPEFFDVSERWAFVLIEIYLVLAFGAVAAYGASLAATSLVPLWLAAASIAFGVAGSLSIATDNPRHPSLDDGGEVRGDKVPQCLWVRHCGLSREGCRARSHSSD